MTGVIHTITSIGVTDMIAIVIISVIDTLKMIITNFSDVASITIK